MINNGILRNDFFPKIIPTEYINTKRGNCFLTENEFLKLGFRTIDWIGNFMGHEVKGCADGNRFFRWLSIKCKTRKNSPSKIEKNHLE